MKTRKANKPNHGKTSKEVVEDPEVNALRLFALLYKIDQRNQEEKGISNKIAILPTQPKKGLRQQ